MGIGCAGGPPQSVLPRQEQTYDMTVALGAGEWRLVARYELRAQHVRGGVWSLATQRSRATIAQRDAEHSFDSDAPAATDPWPVRMQHLVSSVPVWVAFDAQGRPVRLEDTEAWAAEARRVLYASELPTEAWAAGEALIDPAGVLADMQRTFPGTPRPDWRRAERIAGVPAEREEECEREEHASGAVWTCRGIARARTDGLGRLHELQTWTIVDVDRKGLLRMESGYEGTRVGVDAITGAPRDEPVAERREVVRR